jgi:hypothetical protein
VNLFGGRGPLSEDAFRGILMPLKGKMDAVLSWKSNRSDKWRRPDLEQMDG